MVQSVGGTGSEGTIKDLTAYQVYKPMYREYKQDHPESTLSFEAYLVMRGLLTHFNQQVENYIETGNENGGDGTNGNTIKDNKHVSSGNQAIYQSQDEDCYYEFDYTNGTYRKLDGNKEVANLLGMPDDANIDTISFGYNSAAITDYTFGGLDDGQDKSTSYLNGGQYSNVSYTKQEFDMHYILNGLLMDPSDPQYNIAKGIFDDLCAHMDQWLPKSAQAELDAVAKEFGKDSVEFKDKLKSLLIEHLDQAKEWVEEHTHVKNTGSTGSLDPANPDKPADGDDKPKTEVPTYDKDNVLNNAGILSSYTNSTVWTSEKVNRSDKSQDECRNQALAKSAEYASNILNQLETALIAQLGDQCTDEIKTYIVKAKKAALENKSWQGYDWHSAGLNKNKGFTSTCNIKVLADTFFNEFNTLSQNNGKTTAEVEADKKAAEEKKAKESEAYKSLYTIDMNAAAKDAGVDPDKDISVAGASLTAAEIRAKAEAEILAPIKAQIKAKLAGQGISDSDLNTILTNSANVALQDCTSWATTSNNVVYTIDTDKLISMFNDNVKTMVKNKGYNF